MAMASEADFEAHLGAPLRLANSHVKSLGKNQMKTEASELDSEKQDKPNAVESLLINSSQVLEPSSVKEKQVGDAKLLQVMHARTVLSMPDSQSSNAAVRAPCGGDGNAEKHFPPSLKISELRLLGTLPEEPGPELPTPSETSSTEHLRAEQTGSTETTDGVNFAASSDGHESTSANVVIDTAAPFESVKEAVSPFGKKADWKLQSQALEEKMVAPGFDIQKAFEEIAQYKERLIAEDASTIIALRELEKTKGKIRLFKGEAPATSSTEGSLSPSNQPEVVSSVGVAKDLHMSVLHELELAQKEIEGVIKERLRIEALKESAGRESEATITAQEKVLTRIQDLMKEHASRQQSLEAMKGALTETEAHICSLRSIPSLKLEVASGVGPVEISVLGLARLDSNVTDCEASTEKLLKELSTIRGMQVSITEGEILGAKVRLEQAKIAEGSRMAALGRVLEQLDETKLNLKKAIDEGASLPQTIGALQTETSRRRAELESAHETEQIACATLASLQDELCNVRDQVLSAQAGEAKAREARKTLPAAIKQIGIDADEAKATSNLAREEARKGRLEVEQLKASINASLSRLQATQKETEAARASEAMALAEFNALSESDGELAGKITVTIAIEEYHALHDAGQEAEEAANEKVAVVLLQVEAATVSQQEAQGKLDIALKNLEILQKAMEEAQKKANDAQAAKLSVEAELRKWRAEHEHWRKTGSSNPSSVNTSAAQSPRYVNGKGNNGKTVSHSFQGKALANLDSLAEVLTLKVPISEKAAKVMQPTELPKKPAKFKKASFFARVLSILVRKKNKTVT